MAIHIRTPGDMNKNSGSTGARKADSLPPELVGLLIIRSVLGSIAVTTPIMEGVWPACPRLPVQPTIH